MSRHTGSIASVLLGFVVAFVLLVVLLGLVGVDEVAAALLSAKPGPVAAAFLVSLAWMAAWSHTLFLVLGTLEVPTTPRRSFLLFLNVIFANNVAPFSVGGGEPIAALFVSRSARTNYGTALLAVMGTDVLNYLPAPLFAILGLFYVATTATLGTAVEIAVLSLAGVSALFVVLGAFAWRYRRRVERAAVVVLVGLQHVTARVVPSARIPSPDALRARATEFVDGLERVAGDRRVLLLGFGASALGWGLNATALWLSLHAVGASVPVELPVFVVALVTVTDLVPVPGGIGSVDAALVALLVAVAGVPAATATAGALIFRGATLLFPIALGGATVVVLQWYPLPEL